MFTETCDREGGLSVRLVTTRWSYFTPMKRESVPVVLEYYSSQVKMKWESYNHCLHNIILLTLILLRKIANIAPDCIWDP